MFLCVVYVFKKRRWQEHMLRYHKKVAITVGVRPQGGLPLLCNIANFQDEHTRMPGYAPSALPRSRWRDKGLLQNAGNCIGNA